MNLIENMKKRLESAEDNLELIFKMITNKQTKNKNQKLNRFTGFSEEIYQ